MSQNLESPGTTDIGGASMNVSLADILVDLGGIAPDRLRPISRNGDDTPGHTQPATIDDLARAHAEGNLCELVDGVLVEKPVGYRESLLAMIIGKFLLDFVTTHKLGLVSGPDGFITLFSSLVRGPDVAFISWDRLPNRKLPDEAYPQIVPELVVEIISVGNTRAEMSRKRREYFQAGVHLLWLVDPIHRTVAAYDSAISYKLFYEEQSLSGGEVLPGLTIALPEVFAVLDNIDPAKE